MMQPDESRAAYSAAAKDAIPAIEAMREGLKKECLYPPSRSYWEIDANIKWLSPLRSLGRAVLGTADAFDLEGRTADATELRLDLYEMAAVFPRGGGVLQLATGGSIEAMATRHFERDMPKLTSAQLLHVSSRLDRIAARRATLGDAFEVTCYETDLTEDEFLNRRHAFSNPAQVKEFVRAEYRNQAAEGGRSRSDIEMDIEAIQIAMSDKQSIVDSNLRSLERLKGEINRPYGEPTHVVIPKNVITKMGAIVDVVTCKRLTTRYAAGLAILRTEVAAYRYRRNHGRFPPSLSALAPAFISASAVIDPFNGSPLRYQVLKNGQTFVISSVGDPIMDYRHGQCCLVAGHLYSWK